MDAWEIIGFVASAISSIALIPEVKNALQTKHLDDVAWSMLFLLFGASACWFTYGILAHHMPLLISPSINMTMEITLMILKKKYELKDTPKTSNSLAIPEYES